MNRDREYERNSTGTFGALDPSRIILTAERAEEEAHHYSREENNPAAWLPEGASWNARRLFDWAYLRASTLRAMRSGTTGVVPILEHCARRVEEYSKLI